MPPPPTFAPPPFAPPQTYAGFWIRVGAYLIDSLILSVAAIPLMALAAALNWSDLSAFFSSSSSSSAAPTSIPPGLYLFYFEYLSLTLLLHILYFALFWSRGATLGQRVCSLRVVNVAGDHISFPRGLLRYLGFYLSTLPWYLGLFWVVWDPKKQGWHDHIAGTYVVRS